MKKLISIITGLLIITISLAGIGHIMLADAFPVKMRLKHKISSLKSLKYLSNGGVVLNNTSRNITISSDSYLGKIPPGQTSIQAGTKDVDALIIDQPMQLGGKTIDNKVLKFCNLATIELTENGKGEIIINDRKYTRICKLANDYKVYDTVKQAFGQE